MPELPEVETVRSGLEPVLLGQRIEQAEAFSPKLRLPVPKDFKTRLEGQKVNTLTRRAKYILTGLENGTTALLHLGMSGQVLISTQPPVLGKHDHFRLVTDAGTTIVYRDPRRFGLITFCPTDQLEAHKLLRGLGPEPLSNRFNGAALKAALLGKKISIKTALLDQKVVAGVGNIYASEALFRAGINPKRAAGSVSLERCEILSGAVRDVLREAIASGGSTLRDFAHVDGELGYFQHRFEVYDREKTPCPKAGCGGVIRRFTQNARSTYYCPGCQR